MRQHTNIRMNGPIKERYFCEDSVHGNTSYSYTKKPKFDKNSFT